MDFIKSPCIGKCVMDDLLGFCSGCGRTREELSRWFVMTEDEKKSVLELLKGRGYGPI